jgi:hypothetical protein
LILQQQAINTFLEVQTITVESFQQHFPHLNSFVNKHIHLGKFLLGERLPLRR